MNASIAPQAYKESSVLTAPPERLVIMLYDGANRFLRQAAWAMREGSVATTNARLQRAEAIIDELQATLNPDAGELTERLRAIYLWSKRHMLQARLERDPAKLEDVARLLGELRSAWAQICRG